MGKRHVHQPSRTRKQPFVIVSQDGQTTRTLSVRKRRALLMWRKLRSTREWLHSRFLHPSELKHRVPSTD